MPSTPRSDPLPRDRAVAAIADAWDISGLSAQRIVSAAQGVAEVQGFADNYASTELWRAIKAIARARHGEPHWFINHPGAKWDTVVSNQREHFDRESKPWKQPRNRREQRRARIIKRAYGIKYAQALTVARAGEAAYNVDQASHTKTVLGLWQHIERQATDKYGPPQSPLPPSGLPRRGRFGAASCDPASRDAPSPVVAGEVDELRSIPTSLSDQVERSMSRPPSETA